MNIVVITKFLPLPDDSGGKKRSLALLKRLATVGKVTVVGFDDGTGDLQGLRDLGLNVVDVRWAPSKLKWLRGTAATGSIFAGRFWHQGLQTAVQNAIAAVDADVVVAETSALAPYLRYADGRFKVIDMDNIESHLVRRMADTRTGLMRLAYIAESKAFHRLEAKAIAGADLIAVLSEKDAQRLPAPAKRSVMCPNGIDPTPPLPPGSHPVAVFVALMSWAPNEDAALFTVNEIWPLVRTHNDGAELRLVGRNPTAKVQALAAQDVVVTGTVADVEPHLAAARVALAPLRAGGGSRLKILEALNAGRPVVATTIGAEGLEDLIGEGVIVADDPTAFAEAVTALLNDPARAGELGARGHAAIARSYAWDATFKPMVDVLAERSTELDR